MKTVQCPNCGSPATNLRNCEYCGSLFVRFVDAGLLDERSPRVDNLVSHVLPGIEKALADNLERQENPKNDFVCTDIALPGAQSAMLQVVTSGSVAEYLAGQVSPQGLAIWLTFPEEERDREKALAKMREARLFAKGEFNGIPLYTIDFGRDAKGAAYLVSELLVQVYGITPATRLRVETWSEQTESPAVESTATRFRDNLRKEYQAMDEAFGEAFSCFPADARVLTPHGQRAIASFIAGDSVLSRTTNGELVPRRVLRVVRHSAAPLQCVEFVTGAIRATANHRVLTTDGWRRIDELRIGSVVVDPQGVLREVVQLKACPGEPVWNLHTEREHNFVVDGVVVHNFSFLPSLRTALHVVFVDPLARAAILMADRVRNLWYPGQPGPRLGAEFSARTMDADLYPVCQSGWTCR